MPRHYYILLIFYRPNSRYIQEEDEGLGPAAKRAEKPRRPQPLASSSESDEDSDECSAPVPEVPDFPLRQTPRRPTSIVDIIKSKYLNVKLFVHTIIFLVIFAIKYSNEMCRPMDFINKPKLTAPLGKDLKM